MVGSQTPDFAVAEDFTTVVFLADWTEETFACVCKQPQLFTIEFGRLKILNPDGLLALVVGRSSVGVCICHLCLPIALPRVVL